MDINYVHRIPGVSPRDFFDNSQDEKSRGCGPVIVKYAEDMTDKELDLYGLDKSKIAEYKTNRYNNTVRDQDISNKPSHFKFGRFIKKPVPKKQASKNSTSKKPARNAMPCVIDGTRYETLTAGAKSIGVSRTTLTSALKAGKSQLNDHDISWA